jgi:hypothetical protein
VKHGTTLITDGHASYPGLTGYRHDPRIVGKMAGHVVLPWIHRAFSLMKRWSLGTYHGLRRKHVDSYLNEFVFAASTGMFHLKPCLGSPLVTSPRATGTSSNETILARALNRSGPRRVAARPRSEPDSTTSRLPRQTVRITLPTRRNHYI